MSLHITDGEAFHALHLNRISKRHDGWGVYNLGAGNCAVVINTGQLGTGTGTLTVQPGDALLNGTDAVITEQIVNIPQADTASRKDVVVLYPDGTVGREAGTPEPKQPASRELTRSERPAPPDLSTVDCVPLAIVCVPEGATAITAAEIIDVRPPAFVGGSGGSTAASISGRYPGTGTITADGTASSFSWTIETPATLSMALATAATSDASTDFSVTVDDATNTITVSYATAPVGELAWNWAANVSITEVETVTHGAASHDPSVADQADLDAHTTNTSNPHSTSLEQARAQNNLLEGKVTNALSENDFLELNDGSGGTNTAPFTLRFDDKDFRLWAGGVGGIGDALRVGHDSGDVTFGGGFTAQGSGRITGDLAVDGNIAGTVDQADLETKADKDGGGTGTLANYASIETSELNTNRVWDSSGRAHGELTGTNDATVVNNAIADRTPGSSIIIPDPGFDLDWNETVEIPLEERFGLCTVGKPTIVPTSTFPGTAAISRPQGVARYQYIGPLYVKDTNGVLTWAFHLTDFLTSVIDRPSVYNSPGIYINPVETWGNNNNILYPDFRTSGNWITNRNFGTGIRFGKGGLNGETVDQNWIYSPYYNASLDFTANDVAFVDEGKHNQWVNGRIEFAHTGWEFHEKNYFLSLLNFDRATHAENTFVEYPPAYGIIVGISGTHDFQKSQIINPNTRLLHTARSDSTSGFHDRSAKNIFAPLDRLNSASSLSDMGFVDGSNGGSVSIMPPWQGHNWIRINSGPAAGNEGILYWGDPSTQSLQARRYPKVSFVAQNPTGASRVIRFGYYGSETNRAELVYDPGNDLGNHGTEDMFFEVETSGGLQGRVPMSLPLTDTPLALGKKRSEANAGQWYARVGDTVEVINTTTSVDSGTGNLRWYVRTTDASNSTFGLMEKSRMTCWTL